jgi:hypothetical protein
MVLASIIRKMKSMPIDISMIITISLASLAFISSLLLLVLSPRLIGTVAHETEQSMLARSLLKRWTHLFFLEGIACLLFYSGVCILSIITPLQPLSAIMLIAVSAFILSCLLCRYL